MDPITLVVTALAAGAAAGLQSTASQAIKDAYEGLKARVQQRLAGKPAAETALAEHEKDPETWEKPLGKALAEAGVDHDEALLRQAQALLEAAHPEEAARGTYTFYIDEAKGSAFGDHAHVENKWGEG